MGSIAKLLFQQVSRKACQRGKPLQPVLALQGVGDILEPREKLLLDEQRNSIGCGLSQASPHAEHEDIDSLVAQVIDGLNALFAHQAVWIVAPRKHANFESELGTLKGEP